uniref:Cell growth-regulating nucleolar protein n=1 Tax=Leptobrachium leishanense TaxID=445787 RepID=A0A8C5LWZ7_9ANUR
MVFFTCNACGESLKKAQVEKHRSICRNCQCLSCIDCGKDFWGEDYKNHLKCISEDQKYGGKDFEAKANKGDVKQQQWIQKIQDVMKKPNISPNMQNILSQISTYNNIPRKKAKFQNWVKNSLKIHNQALQDQVWEIFSEATSTGTKDQEKTEPANAAPGKLPSESSEQQGETKKSKRERKEERQKKNKKEKKDLLAEEETDTGKKKKAKKRKMENEEENEVEEQDEAREDDPKKKKKKRNAESEEQNGHNEDDAPKRGKKGKHKKSKAEEPCEEQNPVDENEDVASKGKFNWKGTIKALLKRAPDNELPVKRLRKKVISQYYALSSAQHKSEEEILATFNKKLRGNPNFRVLKEKVKLVQ